MSPNFSEGFVDKKVLKWCKNISDFVVHSSHSCFYFFFIPSVDMVRWGLVVGYLSDHLSDEDEPIQPAIPTIFETFESLFDGVKCPICI